MSRSDRQDSTDPLPRVRSIQPRVSIKRRGVGHPSPHELAWLSSLAMPVGAARAWGLPFHFAAPDDALVAPGQTVRWQIGGRARWIVLASACDTASSQPGGTVERRDDERLKAELDAVGEQVAAVTVHYEDGERWDFPLRRRFETAPPYVQWGQQPFLARAHLEDGSVAPGGPHEAGRWGFDQQAVRNRDIDGPRYWLTAVELPHAASDIAAIEATCTGSAILLGAITLWNEPERPLCARRETHVALDGVADPSTIEVIDGTLIRVEACDPPTSQTWGAPGLRGFGAATEPSQRQVVLLAAARGTKVTVDGRSIEVEALTAGASMIAGAVKATRLALPTIPVRLRLLDGGREVAGRVHVRAGDGRELALEDHGRLVSTRWFEDRGTAVRVGGWSYAYVDGAADVLAPPGQLHVEVSRGPEFETMRVVREVRGPTTIELEPARVVDMRAGGWLASDTHVHFLTPQRLHLQARAEGLRLVHLLGAAWGELVTNMEDLGPEAAVVTDEAVVWTGTENRHHQLGHLLSLGTPGVRPLSGGGPEEGRLGGTTSMTVADWATQTRAAGGIAVLAHFPEPYLEAVADLLLGKVDAVEVMFNPRVGSYHAHEYYRFLDLGLRLPLLSGTDKMSADVVLGATRTYTYTGSGDIDFDTWAGAVRAGRTFVSTGPLLQVSIDGRLPGAVVGLDGSARVEWRVVSSMPVGRLELVLNGAVTHSVALADEPDQAGGFTLEVPRRGWVAARVTGPNQLAAGRVGFPFQVGAHTSPWYLPEAARPGPPQISRLRTLLDGAEGWSEMAAWEDEAARERFLDLVAAARARLDVLAGGSA